MASSRNPHETVEGLPEWFDGFTYWELEKLGVWLDRNTEEVEPVNG